MRRVPGKQFKREKREVLFKETDRSKWYHYRVPELGEPEEK